MSNTNEMQAQWTEMVEEMNDAVADLNGALNISDRYPAGERQPQSDRDSGQKVVADDSGGDGASLTGPQDSQADAEPQQTTLGTYAS